MSEKKEVKIVQPKEKELIKKFESNIKNKNGISEYLKKTNTGYKDGDRN